MPLMVRVPGVVPGTTVPVPPVLSTLPLMKPELMRCSVCGSVGLPV